MKKEHIIRIGNQTSFMASAPLDPFFYAIDSGFDAFEWFPDKKESGAGWDLIDIDKAKRNFIKRSGRKNGVTLSVHAPWWADPMKPESEEVFLENIAFAKAIGADLINIHIITGQGIESYAEALIPLIKYTKKAHLKLSIENTPISTPDNFNRLFHLFRKKKGLSVDHVGMCFDLGHANLCSETRNDYIRHLDLLDPEVPIIHVHLHENYGDSDSHLPIFTGPSAENDSGVRLFIERLKKRGFSGSIILEQWPEPPDLLNRARERLLLIIGDYPVQKKRIPEQPLFAPNRFVNELVLMNEERLSWREKLDGIAKIIKSESFEPTSENLAYLAIYCRFLGTGEITCTEDGRHFRPSRHAGLSRDIHEHLLKITTSDNAFVIRKIFPWLPSYDSAFMRSEPLTRIRDIAHRNDIPKDLKKEIKHTLQNKLHRCAGPEDLATSESILSRITAPGADYSGGFVEQFKIFHEELKEFFNATSVKKRVRKLFESGNEKIASRAERFLHAKETMGDTADENLYLLALLTQLREAIVAKLEKEVSLDSQNLGLADTGLEEFAFALLSGLINKFKIPARKVSWKPIIHALSLTLVNLRLSGISPEESRAAQSDLHGWRHLPDPYDRDRLLQVKAAAGRCRRLADEYSETVMGLFFEKALELGRALGVADHAIRVYCEGDIRGNLVFQLSKLVSLLLKTIRMRAGLLAWDVLAPGRAVGRLVRITDLGSDGSNDEDVIALLEMAEGDETIPDHVAGIILPHEIPHLCHLGVRARQQGVVFVTCEERDEIEQLLKRTGELLVLDASSETVSIETAEAGTKKAKEKTPVSIQLPEFRLISDKPLLDLLKAETPLCGAKADGVRRLYKLSDRKRSGFKVPEGIVVPFGVMEQALAAKGAAKKKYEKLVRKAAGQDEAGLAKIAEGLCLMIKGLPVPDEIAKAVAGKFNKNKRLMVRSSSNCEDLESMAGAGLYDSVANVAPQDVAHAVSDVWASLWTKRAAIARRQTGIPHESAHMAVFVQEMITPDYSFVMHTVNPANRNSDEILVELAAGLGETLVSGAIRGTPLRMIVHKKTKRVKILSFANFSFGVQPDQASGTCLKRMEYANDKLTQDKELRTSLTIRLARVGRLVEKSFGLPQDIEGAVAGKTIYIFQARPQQGVLGMMIGS